MKKVTLMSRSRPLVLLKTMFEWLNASGLFSFDFLVDMLDSCVLCA